MGTYLVTQSNTLIEGLKLSLHLTIPEFSLSTVRWPEVATIDKESYISVYPVILRALPYYSAHFVLALER